MRNLNGGSQVLPPISLPQSSPPVRAGRSGETPNLINTTCTPATKGNVLLGAMAPAKPVHNMDKKPVFAPISPKTCI